MIDEKLGCLQQLVLLATASLDELKKINATLGDMKADALAFRPKREAEPAPEPLKKEWLCEWIPYNDFVHTKEKAKAAKWAGKICTACEDREDGKFPPSGSDKAAGWSVESA